MLRILAEILGQAALLQFECRLIDTILIIILYIRGQIGWQIGQIRSKRENQMIRKKGQKTRRLEKNKEKQMIRKKGGKVYGQKERYNVEYKIVTSNALLISNCI